MTNRNSFVHLKEIGRGGGGIVDEVWPGPDASESVALKRLDEFALRDLEVVGRFKREVRILRNLNHPNIVEVLDSDLESENPWFTMPMADHALDVEIRRGPLAETRIEEVLRQILDALIYAHENGVTHRDLKPENILVLGHKVVVSDFGLGILPGAESKSLTRTGTGRGTVGYAAPEQWIDFHSVDFRADIYAVGMLIFNMTTRTDPMAFDINRVPSQYRRVVEKCHRRDPSTRFESMSELFSSLNRIWVPSTSLLSSVERARQLLELSEHDRKSRQELVDLLLSSRNDVELYFQIVGALPRTIIQYMVDESSADIIDVVRNFDTFLRVNFPFEWIDSVANVFSSIFHATEDDLVKAATLRQLLILGSSFNRYHAGRNAGSIIQSARSKSDLELIRDVMEENPDAALWTQQWISPTITAPIVIETLSQIRIRQQLAAEVLDDEEQELFDYSISKDP